MTSQFSPGSDLFLIDDDPNMRDALSVVFTLAGYNVTGFAEADTFLAAVRSNAPVCILLDIHMPVRSGLEVLKALNAPVYPAPIFMISADTDIPVAVEAIKCGAYDYIVKPFSAPDIVGRIGNAIAARAKKFARSEMHDSLASDFPGRDRLTPREHEVLEHIAAGGSNKEAGRRLGISPRTVEVHRARIMEKLGAKNAADLVRIVLTGASGRPPRALTPAATQLIA